MKFVITDVATANLDDIYLTIEGVNRNLKDIMGMCNNVECLPAAADSLTWDVYVDIPTVVSAVGSAAGAGTMIKLTDGGNYINNFQAVTVGQFKAGRAYLILNTATGVTPIIPKVMQFCANVYAGTASSLYSATRYLYVSPKDENPQNASTVDVITYDVDQVAYANAMREKQVRKAGEIAEVVKANSK